MATPESLTTTSPKNELSDRCALARLCRAAEVIRRPAHLKRTVLKALLVGSWLTFFNLGGALVANALTWPLALKIALNYATPFVVANIGLLSRVPR
ncbi:MAG: hypothetical protein WA914_06015 [Candidatus Macondimonas sp.]